MCFKIAGENSCKDKIQKRLRGSIHAATAPPPPKSNRVHFRKREISCLLQQHRSHLARFYFIYFILSYFIEKWVFQFSVVVFKTYMNAGKTANEFSTEISELIQKTVMCVLKFGMWAILLKLEEHVAWFKLNGSISLCKIICLASLVEDKEGKKRGDFTGICTEMCPAFHWPCCIPSSYLGMYAMYSVGPSASARKEIKMGNQRTIILNSLKYCNCAIVQFSD